MPFGRHVVNECKAFFKGPRVMKGFIYSLMFARRNPAGKQSTFSINVPWDYLGLPPTKPQLSVLRRNGFT